MYEKEIRFTKAVLKFCVEHKYQTTYIGDIEECLRHLENHDIKNALHAYSNIPFGGNGCFNDWFPPVVFKHENGEYAWTVFEALVGSWTTIMYMHKNDK